MSSHSNVDCALDQWIRSAQEEEQRNERKRLFHGTRVGASLYLERMCKIFPDTIGESNPFLLTLYVEGRNVAGADVEIGFKHQGLEKYLERKDRWHDVEESLFALPLYLALEKVGCVPVLSCREKLVRIISYESRRIRHHLDVIAQIVQAAGTGSPGDDLERTRRDTKIRRQLEGRVPVNRQEAIGLGLSGLFLRATGLSSDARVLARDLPYEMLNVVPQTNVTLDAYGRFLLRFFEIEMSTTLIDRAKHLLQEESLLRQKDETQTPRSASVRIEAPEGEMIVSVWLNAQGDIHRVRLKTPSFSIVSAIPTLLAGADIDDVAIILMSLGVNWMELDR